MSFFRAWTSDVFLLNKINKNQGQKKQVLIYTKTTTLDGYALRKQTPSPVILKVMKVTV